MTDSPIFQQVAAARRRAPGAVVIPESAKVASRAVAAAAPVSSPARAQWSEGDAEEFARRLLINPAACKRTGAGSTLHQDDVSAAYRSAGGDEGFAQRRAALQTPAAAAGESDDVFYERLFGEVLTPATAPVTSVPVAAGRSVAAASKATHVEVQSRMVAGKKVMLDPWGPNPVVEDLRQVEPEVYALATREGAPPTLFETGNLPPFTASGLDPSMLNKLPWDCRHFAAHCPDRGTVLEMIEAAVGDPDVGTFRGWARDLGVSEYVYRVQTWALGPRTMTGTTA